MTRDRVLTALQESAFEHGHNLIHVFTGGSALHGATGDSGKADLDIYGIFMEPKEYIYGLSTYSHFVSSTSNDRTRNTTDDIDITLYSLRRWAGLAAKGNPTALQFLWADNLIPARANRLWEAVANYFPRILPSKRACNAYRGFVTDQMKRLLGEKGQGKHGQRPELTASHGYDTKAAMHSVRLVGEGIELMKTGRITFPRPNVDELKAIRRGEFSLDRVCNRVSSLLTELDEAERASPMRDKPNFEEVDRMLVHLYERFYQED